MPVLLLLDVPCGGEALLLANRFAADVAPAVDADPLLDAILFRFLHRAFGQGTNDVDGVPEALAPLASATNLTRRQHELLRARARGLEPAAVRATMGISRSTYKTYAGKIIAAFAKLDPSLETLEAVLHFVERDGRTPAESNHRQRAYASF